MGRLDKTMIKGWPEHDGLGDEFGVMGSEPKLWADHGCIMEYVDDYSFTPWIITTGQMDIG